MHLCSSRSRRTTNRGVGMVAPGDRTAQDGRCPPDEYTEYHENVLDISINSSAHSCKYKSILRCQDRQSGDTEYLRKPFGGQGTAPDPAGEAYSAPRPSKTKHCSPAVGWDVRKIFIYVSNLSALCSTLYASETCTLGIAVITILEAFHMKCQRQILRIRWPTYA